MSVQVVLRGGMSGRTAGQNGGNWRRESERRDVLITSIDVHLQWIDVWSVLHHAQGSTGRNAHRAQAMLAEGWARIEAGVNRDGQMHSRLRI